MFLLLSLLLFGTLTLSTSLSEKRQESRTDIYVCGDAKFDNTNGTCRNYPVVPSECFDLPSEASKIASSAGPNEGTFCVLYSCVSPWG
jgi:hypothetical protein